MVTNKFDLVGYFHNGLALCGVNGKEGCINTKGEYIIKPSSNISGWFNDDKNITVDIKSKSYLADIK
ncbi:hypothetical protein FDC62_08265 [Clostridium botulinum]|uniref:hypothetical protein n=1 Tax=Clostridium botulinum TaxID=1491 RepID=UPI00052CC850|nr:hypothetical protein [Clostridium botulinum]KGM92917.1 hypothetical protein Z956_12990 [Clostridium botulinum D str. CCUG 7971]KOC49937.1 hypothetical protein ADU88_04360 [Clostridium botulinum]NFO98200.1 hypothetical protein [Clostridium botulinum]OOV52018.1 hypothetical protein B1A66_06150 [Clostridium botulinum D/C]OOV54579.1 hypothetical protein B1A67_10410 [Clostridium botulinum D/C]